MDKIILWSLDFLFSMEVKNTMKILITTVLLCLTMTAGIFAGDSYLCVADMATGFKYNKTTDKWEITKFKIDDSKYIVSRPKDKEIFWEVKRIGDSDTSSYCNEGFSPSGLLLCEGPIYFKMNKSNLKYLITYSHGYWFSIGKGQNGKYITDTPYIEIGKCSPLP